MVREKQKVHSIDEQLQKFEEQLRHELRLAASLGGEEGQLWNARFGPSGTGRRFRDAAVANELVELAGD